MGKDLCARFAVARKIFADADRVLGRELSRICFEGPEAQLTKTVNAQPGIFVTSLACLEALKFSLAARKSRGGASVPLGNPNEGQAGSSSCHSALNFEATAGLSLGEFTALTAAGAMSFEDGLRLVQLRGQFMQEACDLTNGGMASVLGLDETTCAEVCREADVDLANLNCPGQIVISGEKEKIAKAVELAKARGAKRAVPLNVAGAYHSRLMVSAQEKLAAALRGVAIASPKVIVVSNVTAQPTSSPDDIRTTLTRQVTGSVRWEDSMRWLSSQGFTRFIELGPGNVLSGLMKRINKEAEMISVSDGASLDAAVAKLGA
jgi:[acyl-carrier-protein] S-malonyltransferase